jgi:3-hydroxyacyl-[acyl-carrier-protein] dehydratase
MELFPVTDVAPASDGWSATVCVPRASRYFEGHFDGAPLLSAVGQFALLTQALAAHDGRARALAGLRAVRFKQSIEPGDELQLAVTGLESGKPRFLLQRAGELISSGSFQLAGEAAR